LLHSTLSGDKFLPPTFPGLSITAWDNSESRKEGREISAKELKVARKRKKEVNVVAVRRGKKLTTVALDRVVDMMFPRLLSGTYISNLPSLDIGKANLFISMSG
jgi:hypothetical protein